GLLLAGAPLAVLPPRPGLAAEATPGATSGTDEEVALLRRELDALRQEYASRMAAIEAKLATIEAARVAAATTTTTAEPAPPPPVVAQAAPPPTASKAFNPDIAAIGNFVGAAGESPGGGEPSLNMQEAELSFQAAVDPYARADFFVTLSPEEVALEEGTITFPTLPGGLLTKVGKMRDAFGKVNSLHPHTMPWIDRPLVTRNLTGGEDGLADAGVSVARLIPNPWLFLEATAQVYQGNSAIFEAPTRGDLAYVGHLRAYRDLGESTNLDLGGSIAYGHNGLTADTTTRLLGVDATLRWKPLRRSIYTHFLARGELTWSRAEEEASPQSAFGGYLHAEYKFARRWVAGLRYDSSERAFAPGLRDTGGSFLLTFRPSEFSLLRAQYRRTSLADADEPLNELLFQLQFAIGAHGAHPF
ncbi:MAG TPA: hypothetical protein VGB87_19015, partial [Vicinamibacteria bacterium]